MQSIAYHCQRQRPYRVECTGSLPNSEVKRRRARLVLGWGTAREDLRVLLAFCLRLPAAACCVEAGNGAVKAESPWGCDSTGWPVAGVPRLLDSTATGGSVQAAVWNAVCKHDWKVGIVSMRGVKCVLKLCSMTTVTNT